MVSPSGVRSSSHRQGWTNMNGITRAFAVSRRRHALDEFLCNAKAMIAVSRRQKMGIYVPGTWVGTMQPISSAILGDRTRDKAKWNLRQRFNMLDSRALDAPWPFCQWACNLGCIARTYHSSVGFMVTVEIEMQNNK